MNRAHHLINGTAIGGKARTMNRAHQRHCNGRQCKNYEPRSSTHQRHCNGNGKARQRGTHRREGYMRIRKTYLYKKKSLSQQGFKALFFLLFFYIFYRRYKCLMFNNLYQRNRKMFRSFCKMFRFF